MGIIQDYTRELNKITLGINNWSLYYEDKLKETAGWKRFKVPFLMILTTLCVAGAFYIIDWKKTAICTIFFAIIQTIPLIYYGVPLLWKKK